jgi:hypothetical protein
MQLTKQAAACVTLEATASAATIGRDKRGGDFWNFADRVSYVVAAVY